MRKYLLAYCIFASRYLRILYMDTRRDVFQAIADPTRRAILVMLTDAPQNLHAIAENFTVSRQAISLHIKILTECGLLVIHQKGRERYCRVKPDKIKEVHAWTDHFRVFWDKKLDALDGFLKKEQATVMPKTKQKTLSSSRKIKPHEK
jgi:DNA-binding transcriptional ArsR family regulator